MPKLVLAAIFFVALVVAGLPPVFGFVAERSVIQALGSVPDDPAWEVSLVRYSRGLYSSQATVDVTPAEDYLASMRDLLEDEEPGELLKRLQDGVQIDLDIQHGPVGFGGGPFVGWSRIDAELDTDTENSLTESLTETLSIPYLVRVQLTSGFGGVVNFAGDIPPVSVTEAESVIDFSGMLVTGSYSDADDRLIYDFIIESVSGGSAAADYSVEGIRSSANNVFITDDLAIGLSGLTVDRAEIGTVAMPGSGLVMEDMRVAVDARLDEAGDEISADVSYRLVAVRFPPDARLADLNFVLKIEGVDVDSAQAYMELVQELEPADPATADALPEELVSAAFRVLQGSPTIAIDPLAFLYNDESFAGMVSVTVIGERLPELDMNGQDDAAAYLNALSARASLEVDESLALSVGETLMTQQLAANLPPDMQLTREELAATAKIQANMFLQTFITQGMLTRGTDGKVLGNLEFTDGELTVNGNPIPLGGLVQGD